MQVKKIYLGDKQSLTNHQEAVQRHFCKRCEGVLWKSSCVLLVFSAFLSPGREKLKQGWLHHQSNQLHQIQIFFICK
jgi:antibiotic biosynthesis monooxygenase (ABM) superfamily enzyme